MLKIKYLALSLFVVLFLSHQNLTAQIAEMTATSPSVSEAEKSLLWEISGKDLTKPSYLYGTIHMIPKQDFFLTEETKKAIAASQKVTFEINMKEMNNPMALIGVFMKAMMPNGTRLRDLLSADDYQLVKNRFDSIGMPITMLERVKPMFLSALTESDGAQFNPMDTSATDQKTVSY